MRVVSIVCFGVVLAGSGCAGEIDGMDGEDVPDTCDDPAYGDGTCDLETSCEAPDIDCYYLFADEPEARAWFAGKEEAIAASEFRQPRALLPVEDAHYTRMRALLDEGWDAYKQVTPVGDLRDMAPELVVIEDMTKNAFALGDGTKAGWVVMVHTGLMDAASDEQLVAIVMHELTHAVRLHVFAEVNQRIRRHYIAADGEPFGYEQADDPVARAHITDWRALAADVGPHDAAPLVGFPMSTGNPTLFRQFLAVSKAWSQTHQDVCAGPMTAVGELMDDIMSYYSQVDQTLQLAGVEESLTSAQNSVLVAMRDQCMPALTASYIDLLAEANQVTPDEMRAMLPDEDEALVEGKHFIEAIATLMNDRRIKMRAIEADFAAEAGVAWSRGRHYTTEEEADDATIPVLAAMERAPDGIGPGLLLLDDEATVAACNELLGQEAAPPYGANYFDDHHANCFRVWHVRELAASGRLTDGAASSLRRPAPAAARRPARYQPIPYPKSPSDYIMY